MQMGMGLFIFTVATIVLQIVASGVVGVIAQTTGFQVLETWWGTWVVNFVPMYCIALPIALSYMNKALPDESEGEKMTGGRFIRLLLVCFPIMYVGNIIGTMLSAILSGFSAENPLVGLTSDMGVIGAVVVVLIGPFVEELVFRKTIIDRTVKYGEKTAIIFSALCFGLFHMNLFQFFYAFGLGLVFGYVYVRTRDMKWSLIMHCIVNFMGSVVAPWVAGQLPQELMSDPEALANIGEAEMAQFGGAFAVYGLYLIFYLALVVAGVVIFIRHRKSIRLEPKEEEIPKEEVAKTCYATPGFIAFAVACAVMIVASLVM